MVALGVELMLAVLVLLQPDALVVVSVRLYADAQHGLITLMLCPVVAPVIVGLPQWAWPQWWLLL
jgi:hypothetical protein